MIKKLYLLFFGLLFIYMVMPGPSQISDFKALPTSDKSKLAGDTFQIPNVSGYFSNNFRKFVVSFYLTNYWQKTFLPFPPIRLNYPPEYSWVAIKKHTDSTYLEELIYPLRDSVYINGFEPFYEDGTSKFWGASTFNIEKNSWFTKTTLRFYPSLLGARILVWLGITLSAFWIIKLSKKII